MSELKERLDRELASITPSVGAREAVGRRLVRRSRRRRVVVPVVTVFVTAAIVGGLTYAFRPVPPSDTGDATSIALPGEPSQAIVYGDALWVLTQEPGCEGPVCSGFIAKVDTRLGEVVDEVPMLSPQAVEAGAGSIWVASFADDTVVRIDPTTARIEARIPLILPFEVADGDRRFLPFDLDATDDAVWVSTGRGVVAHIDPSTNEVVGMARLPGGTGGPVAIGNMGVWVVNGLNGAILVDPLSRRVVDAVKLDDEAGQRFSMNTLVARDGAIWVVGNWAHPVEELDGLGYVAGEGHAVIEIDERDGNVDSILDIRDGPAWLLSGDDLWVVESDGASLQRLDTVRGELTEPISVPFGRPLVVSGQTAWSAVDESIRSWSIEPVAGESIEPPTGMEQSALVQIHRRYEEVLNDLWTAEARLDELRGEIERARESIQVIRDEVGSGTPTREQRIALRQERDLIRRFTLSAAETQAVVSSTEAQTALLQTRRSLLLPPADASVFPDVATITCDGDATGGTRLSSPVVRRQEDGVHLQVENLIRNERVNLVVGQGDPWAILPGETLDIVVASGPARDLQIVCTYEHPRDSWERPTHLLWIAPSGD